jgi:hypothetical protein
MLTRSNDVQELERVNMFIRAIAADMTEMRGFNNERADSITLEMEEALYELRVRKLLISALIDSNNVGENITTH